MTYAARLTEGIEEPDSSLRFWSWVAGRAENRGSKLESGVFGTQRSKQGEVFRAAVAEMLIIWGT